MRELKLAIKAELVDLFGTDSVFFGSARGESFPYVTYSQEPSSPTEYCTGEQGTNDNRGKRTTFPFLFTAFTTDDETAGENISKIVDRFEKVNLVMPNDHLLLVTALTQNVSEEPDQKDDGQTVYQGTAVIEFSISKGAK